MLSTSIFSQKLDRAIFVTYFLGAIVPLIALGFVMERYVLSAVSDDQNATIGMLGMMCSISLLSLGAFFSLRRLTNNAVGRMDADYARLKGILTASNELSSALHVQAVTEVAVGCARTLTSASAVLLFMRTSEGKTLDLLGSSGDQAQAVFSSNEELIRELIENCIANQRPVALGSGAAARKGASGRSDTIGAALVFPLILEGGGSGSVVVLKDSPDQGGFSLAERDAMTTLSSLIGVALHNVELQNAQRNFFAHITEFLVAVMDSHVDGRKGHAMSVAELSNRLARELSLPEANMQRLHFASLLHDLGMLKIEQAQQRSPGHFQRHPQIAHRVLSRIRLWEDVAPIVLYHHEWFDGSGYPEGISGEEIPLEARIIAVADSYDAMIRPDKHRMAMTTGVAVEEVRAHAGSQFDPRVVKALEQLAQRGEIPGASD